MAHLNVDRPTDVDEDTHESWKEFRRREILEDGHHRRVECPRCGARIGEACRSENWHRTLHKARRLIAGPWVDDQDR